LRFHLSPRWKEIKVDTFCVGGPGKTPHVVAQFRVPGHGKLELPLSLPEGVFRFRTGGDDKPVTVEINRQGSPRVAGLLTDSGLTVSETTLYPTTALTIQNEGTEERTVALERTEWADDACTASYVTTFQEFRDLFGSDVLAAGVAVKVAHAAILFTDLKGSTALYQKAGDAPAFGLVSEHFDRLIAAVREHRGAVVKTIGDAVMAAFLDPADAVRAAVAMHASVADLDSPDGEPVLLKIGLHTGPCFAVTLSDRLDYFGTTVNLAARIQNEAQGGDIVLHRSLADQPAIRQVLGSYAAAPFSASLKGIDGAQELQRFLVQSLPA
jgi:class 3 adenylate cyclase